MRSTPHPLLTAILFSCAALAVISCAPDEDPAEAEDTPLTTMMPAPSGPAVTGRDETVTTGTMMAPAVPGREAFLSLRCDRCHAVSIAAIRARTEAGPDLSGAGTRAPEELAIYISGAEHPDPWNGTPEQARQIAMWLAQQSPR